MKSFPTPSLGLGPKRVIGIAHWNSSQLLAPASRGSWTFETYGPDFTQTIKMPQDGNRATLPTHYVDNRYGQRRILTIFGVIKDLQKFLYEIEPSNIPSCKKKTLAKQLISTGGIVKELAKYDSFRFYRKYVIELKIV